MRFIFGFTVKGEGYANMKIFSFHGTTIIQKINKRDSNGTLHFKEKESFSLADWVQQYTDLVAGFTTKNGGQSERDLRSLKPWLSCRRSHKRCVRQNRENVSDKLDFPLEDWVGPNKHMK